MTPLEDRTVPAAIPLTGPNGGEWVKVDTLTIATRTNQTAATGVTSAIALDAGKTYLAVAHGTARIANDTTGFTDAEFIRYNKATGPQDGSSPGFAPNNHGIRLTGVEGGTTTGNFWGTYQSDHVYTKLVQGQGTTITSYYSDIPGYYGDNSGTLTVDLYEESNSGPGLIGGVVWQDEIPGTVSDSNGDGIRQSNELLLPDMTIDLLDLNGLVVASTTTDATGAYQFANLRLGQYSVQFYLPPLTNFTPKNQGNDDTIDSDSNANGLASPVVLIAENPVNVGVGAGLIATAPPPRPLEKAVFFMPGESGQLLDANGQLKIAKWEDAFVRPLDVASDVPLVRKPDARGLDFIDREVDRFHVMVYDPASWNATIPTITASISTTNVVGYEDYNDNSTQISLSRMTQVAWKGWYWSDSQILVSNQVDDKYSDDNVQIDNLGPSSLVNTKLGTSFLVSDRTHMVALGGLITAKYGTVEKSASVPVEKIVKLHVTILQTHDEKPVISASQVQSDITRMREIYAQVGIRVVVVDFNAVGQVVEIASVTNDQFRKAPLGVNLTDGLSYNGEIDDANKLGMTPEEISLLGTSAQKFGQNNVLYRTPTTNAGTPNAKDDIEVYYVNHFNPDDLEGQAYPAGFVPDIKYGNSVIIQSDRSYTALAHEVMHVLLEAGPQLIGHSGKDPDNPTPTERTNLLVAGKFSLGPVNYVIDSSRVIDSRRLTDDQGRLMRTSITSLIW